MDNKKQTPNTNAGFKAGMIFGTVIVACMSSVVIGITVKILRWLLF